MGRLEHGSVAQVGIELHQRVPGSCTDGALSNLESRAVKSVKGSGRSGMSTVTGVSRGIKFGVV